MRAYRRILVAIPACEPGEPLLQRAAALAGMNRDARVLVACLSGPADAPARPRLASLRQRLDLLLARNNLAWAETRIAAGDARAVLADLIRSWRPDLLLACRSQLPQNPGHGLDILTPGTPAGRADASERSSPRA